MLFRSDADDNTPRTDRNISLNELKNSWMAKKDVHTIFISAKKKTNLPEFRELLYKTVRDIHVGRYPYDNFLYPDVTEANL